MQANAAATEPQVAAAPLTPAEEAEMRSAALLADLDTGQESDGWDDDVVDEPTVEPTPQAEPQTPVPATEPTAPQPPAAGSPLPAHLSNAPELN